jgi:CheY-like chemotaxis protein
MAKRGLRARGRARVVVVDDEPFLLGGLRRLLVMEGYAVEAFTDPLAARDRLLRDGDVDVVITDHWMSALTGAQLAQQVRRAAEAAGRTAPAIVALTGDLRSVDALPSDVFDVLIEKPCDPEDLLGRLAGQMRARQRRRGQSGIRMRGDAVDLTDDAERAKSG